MKKIIIRFISCILLSGNLNAQSSWYAVNDFHPYPTFFYGIDACFINDSVGFVIDDYISGIYKTTNRGERWDSIASNLPQAGYRSIAFANDTLGFASTLSGVVTIGPFVKTIDGGHTWTTLVDSLLNPMDGVCGIEIYDNRVVGVGNWQGPALFCKSDDYGATWSVKNLSPLATGLVDCHFIEKDTLLVSGLLDSAGYWKGVILKSWDGGNTWQEVFRAKGSINIIWKMFIRPSGKGLASVQNVSPAVDSTTIAVTNDFGTTWQEITVPQIPIGQYWMGGVCLLNDTLGWFSCEYGGDTYETHDGGYTWSLLPGKTGVNRFCVLDSVTVIAPANQIDFGIIAKYGTASVGIKNTGAAPLRKKPWVNIITNPVNNILQVQTEALISTRSTLQILNAEGKIVDVLFRGYINKGKVNHSFSINIPTGMYYLCWFTNEGFVAEKFEVER